MKKSTQLRYLSMALFIVGYVGLSYYMDPWLLFLGTIALVGFTTVKDVIEMEGLEKSLEDHQKIADNALAALKEFKELLEKEKQDEPIPTDT